MEEDSDKVTLIRTSGRQDAQKQSFMVSDEVAHVEERARKMESLEVKFSEQPLCKKKKKKKAMVMFNMYIGRYKAVK